MANEYKIQNVLDEVNDISDEFSRDMFDRKHFGTLNDLASYLNSDFDQDSIKDEEIFLVPIELNYRWSKSHYRQSISSPLDDEPEDITPEDIPKKVISPQHRQLETLQELNIAIFKMLENSPSLKRKMVNKFCFAAINTDNFGEHKASALLLYETLTLYASPYISTSSGSEMSRKPSIRELWRQLKTWQKITAVLAILILTALTILAAISGVGLIVEVFGVSIFGAAIISWLGLTPLALGAFGALNVASSLAFAAVTKAATSNPHCLFPSSCLPDPMELKRMNNKSNLSIAESQSKIPKSSHLPTETGLKRMEHRQRRPIISAVNNPSEHSKQSSYPDDMAEVNYTYRQL